MTAFPFFDPDKTQRQHGIPANRANSANPSSEISSFSTISGPTFGNSDFKELCEERAAIMQFDAGDVHPDRQAATTAALENCKVIWLRERNRHER